MNQENIREEIAKGETLAVEFKSDRGPLRDRELIAAVVALLNTEGGILYLGVEDDGTVTGLHKSHQNLVGLSAMIANKTIPSQNVQVESVTIDDLPIARIIIRKSLQLVASSEGLLLKRRLKIDGKPEAVPFYPHEFTQHQSSLGLLDPSAMKFENLSADQLDPLQRVRIRNAIKKYGGDQSLASLGDDELDGALGLTVEQDGRRCPTVTGLLFLGSEELLRQYLPAYEVAFQVLAGTDVRVNEFFRKPILESFEEIELLFKARFEEEEIQLGLFRVPIPNFDRRAFREAVVNALVHRDFSRLGAVHIKFSDEGLSISNPGGFVDGVTLQNLLVADPRSRNPLLADAMKRIGLAERTGRGIDRIFEGMLRYGRPRPDYSRSDRHTVSVQMSNAAPDFGFLKLIVENEDQFGLMPIDSLIILSRLREERRLTMADLLPSVQKSEAAVRGTLEKLTEAGLLSPLGTGRGRSYTLSAKLYQKSGKKAEYIRQAGFDKLQQEQMILKYIDSHDSIKRAEAADLCQISPFQATRVLKKLVEGGAIVSHGKRKGTFYARK